MNSQPFTIPKPNFFGGHKFSIPYRNQSRAVKRFGCYHCTPIFLNELFLLKRRALNRAKMLASKTWLFKVVFFCGQLSETSLYIILFGAT